MFYTDKSNGQSKGEILSNQNPFYMFYTDKSNGQSKGEILSNQNHTSKGPTT